MYNIHNLHYVTKHCLLHVLIKSKWRVKNSSLIWKQQKAVNLGRIKNSIPKYFSRWPFKLKNIHKCLNHCYDIISSSCLSSISSQSCSIIFYCILWITTLHQIRLNPADHDFSPKIRTFSHNNIQWFLQKPHTHNLNTIPSRFW